jgi:hypothetical protein
LAGLRNPRDFAFGAVIGVVQLVDVVPVERLEFVEEEEALIGEFSIGRNAWVLREPRLRARPFFIHGQPGLWEVPDGHAAVDLAYAG